MDLIIRCTTANVKTHVQSDRLCVELEDCSELATLDEIVEHIDNGRLATALSETTNLALYADNSELMQVVGADLLEDFVDQYAKNIAAKCAEEVCDHLDVDDAIKFIGRDKVLASLRSTEEVPVEPDQPIVSFDLSSIKDNSAPRPFKSIFRRNLISNIK